MKVQIFSFFRGSSVLSFSFLFCPFFGGLLLHDYSDKTPLPSSRPIAQGFIATYFRKKSYFDYFPRQILSQKEPHGEKSI
jgi:hypothetical protein